jgi:hypothetical protein
MKTVKGSAAVRCEIDSNSDEAAMHAVASFLSEARRFA